MARVLTKSSSDPWPVPGDGDTIHLLAGIHEAHEFDATEDLTIQGEAGAIVRGSITPRGGEPRCTLRFPDGCHGLKILGPLEITGSYGRGLRITASERVVISGIKSHGHGIEAIQMGDCPGAQVIDCECYGSVDGDPSYTADKHHGLYISGNASDTRVKGLHAHSVTGSGFQANGPGEGAIIRNLHVSEMLLEKCGSGGTPPISLMGVQDSFIEQFCITDVSADRWVVLFADGQGVRFACRRVRFSTYSVPEGAVVSQEEGSASNIFVPGSGWSPSPAPTPDPPPPPPPKPDPLGGVRAALSRCDEPLSALAHHANGVRSKLMRAALKQDQQALAAAVADAKKALPAG